MQRRTILCSRITTTVDTVMRSEKHDTVDAIERCAKLLDYCYNRYLSTWMQHDLGYFHDTLQCGCEKCYAASVTTNSYKMQWLCLAFHIRWPMMVTLNAAAFGKIDMVEVDPKATRSRRKQYQIIGSGGNLHVSNTVQAAYIWIKGGWS